jgi:DNA invertase Pin-like site-specific DNA recombinase
VKTPNPTPVAYSYIRFSSPEQRKGDSLRRQTDGALAWCEREGVTLDTGLTLHDKGCSAYKGLHKENPDKHALALFLKLIERGRVRRGDYLVIENLDRLSREEEVPACHLLTGILVAGVRVVQLSPYEMLLTEKATGWELMRAVMELSRGHGESAIKSERVDKAWQRRLEKTRRGEVVLTRSLPAWVQERDGGLVAIPERAAAVRLVYQLAGAGYGHTRIVKALIAEAIRPFGGREWYTDDNGEQRLRAAPGDVYGSGQWTKAYIHKLLSDRRVLGEFQPLKADGSPDGPMLATYFPQVVTPQEWSAARAGAVRRGQENGRKTNNSSKHVDVFAGMVRDARDGGTMFCITRTAGGCHTRVIINANSREGRIPSVTFPYPVLERGILSKLQEIDAAEVLGPDTAPSEVAALSGEWAKVEAELSEAAAFMRVHGFSPTIGKQITDLETRKLELEEKLADAQRRAQTPMASAWGEAQSLAGAIDNAADPDGIRVRLRTALRRAVESIWLLVVPRGRDRLAVAQIRFAGRGERRDYLLLHRWARGGAVRARPASWLCGSLADVARGGDFDLRKRDHAGRLGKVLERLDLDLLGQVLDEIASSENAG